MNDGVDDRFSKSYRIDQILLYPCCSCHFRNYINFFYQIFDILVSLLFKIPKIAVFPLQEKNGISSNNGSLLYLILISKMFIHYCIKL